MTTDIRQDDRSKEKIFKILQGKDYHPVSTVVLHAAGAVINARGGTSPWWKEYPEESEIYAIDTEGLCELAERFTPRLNFHEPEQNIPVLKKLYEIRHCAQAFAKIGPRGELHLVTYYDDDTAPVFHYSTHKGHYDIAWNPGVEVLS